MTNYKPPTSLNWSGRISDEPEYWYQQIKMYDLLSDSSTIKNSAAVGVGLLGYACDAGVKRNLGRIGAAEGPSAIRKSMGTMAWHLDGLDIWDCGDIRCEDDDMEVAQDSLGRSVERILKLGILPIVMGGGHDMAFGHYQGIRNYIKGKKKAKSLGIINLDAHFDLRAVIHEGNSGTPFTQILADSEEVGLEIDYAVYGIQLPSNTRSLFDRANEMDVDYIIAEEFQLNYWNEINVAMEDFMGFCDYIYLSIDMDVFSSAYAPGVSAPSPMGCSVDIVIQVIDSIMQTGKLLSVDIAELNPMYDIDNQTSRLAARIIERICQRKLTA